MRFMTGLRNKCHDYTKKRIKYCTVRSIFMTGLRNKCHDYTKKRIK